MTKFSQIDQKYMKFKELITQNPCYPVFGTENVKNVIDFAEEITPFVKIIQLREKKLETKKFYENALKIKKICEKYNCKLIINDRIDLALAIDADGVHIGQSDMSYKISRKLLGKNKIIGLSLDCRKDSEIANHLDVDYVAINGVFPSKTKNVDDHIWGTDGLQFAKKKSIHSVIAIGGVCEQNIQQIAGLCDGFSVISDICNANDPVAKIHKLNYLFSL